MERECYVVMLRNDRDYDEIEEWVDRIFESLDDAYAYLVDDLGFTLVSEETLFFVRRVKEGEPERFYGECNEENGGQSAWIDRKKFMPNEWSRWEVPC
jgi:hypothetical protein